jgi:protein SCO1
MTKGMKKIYCCIVLLAFIVITACTPNKTAKKLPILGERDTTMRLVAGSYQLDSVMHTIPDFDFINQDGEHITQKNVEGKIYLVDFFFTTCPTICPRVKKNMLKIAEDIKGDPDILILSHTIDPKHDSVSVLHTYAAKLHINTKQWLFLTGDKEKIYAQAHEYLVAVQEDTSAAGGFTHSGNVMLIDKKRQIRGYYNGLKESDMQNLADDIKTLKAEK